MLTKSDCPLLAEHADFPSLLEGYLPLAESFELLEKQPQLLQWIRERSIDRELAETRETLQAAREDADIGNRFASVRDRLAKQRFRVGFVGRSQVGKSSAVNALVGLDVLPYGAGGKACTSSVTRLQFYSPDDSQQCPTITPLYMSPEDCDQRIRFFASQKNLALAEDEALQDLDYASLLAAVDAEIKDTQNPKKREELQKLQVLLISRDKFQHLLGSDATDPTTHCKEYGRVEDLIDELPEFVQTRPGEAARQSLYREVLVSVPAADVSSTLELIDLPGLGSANIEDDELTRSYIRTLDGLVVFTNPALINGVVITPLLEELKARVGNISERAWLVVSVMDEIRNTAASYYSQNSAETTFATILDTVNRHEMNAKCIRLLSVKTELDGKYQLMEKLDDETRYKALKLDLLSTGDPKIPPALNSPEYHTLKPHFEALVADGGIGELRNICRETIALHVRDAEIKKARQELDDVGEALTSLVNLAKTHNEIDVESAQKIAAWSGLVKSLCRDIGSDNSFYQRSMEPLFDTMWNTLVGLSEASPEQADLLEHHQLVSQQLLAVGSNALFDAPESSIKLAYQGAAQALADRASSNAILRSDPSGESLPGFAPIGELERRGLALVERLRKKRQDGSVRNEMIRDLQQLSDDGFLQDGSIRPEDYQRIMERKLESVCYTLVQRVHNCLAVDCNELAKNWKLLGNTNETEKFADDSFFDQLCEVLGMDES